MKTTKLYQQDVYMKKCDAVIISASPADADSAEKHEGYMAYQLTLDRTPFFPEGGGQSCDLGTIGGFNVIDVQEISGEVLHTVLIPYENEKFSQGGSLSADSLYPGKTVSCEIDWERRFDNMQRHCGEHILSGSFFKLFGGVNRGFHMGHEYMTIDISTDETEITYEKALEAELDANSVIWENAPVTVRHFETREEAESLPLRKPLALDEDISIVSVGSIENAADCVACCGTHPDTAGQVGLIKIYKVENYKGMFRIYFDAGKRALNDFRKKHDILSSISQRYSSSIDELESKLSAQEEKLHAVKDELYHIKKAMTEQECDRFDEILSQSDTKVAVYPLKHFSLDDAFNMAKNYMPSSKGKPAKNKTDKPENSNASAKDSRSLHSKLAMLYSEKDTSYILISDGNIDCGSLVKEYASFYNGKGGGNKISARAIFNSKEDAALFADLIHKHLK